MNNVLYLLSEFTGTAASTYTVGAAIAAILAVASYVIVGLALFTIAKYYRLPKAWLAWIPVAQFWVMGSISDLYQQVNNHRTTNRARLLLILQLLPLALTAVLSAFLVAALVRANGELSSVYGVLLVYVLGMLAAWGIAVWSAVIQILALFDVYRFQDTTSAVPYLILSILIPFAQPILLLVTCDRIARKDYTKFLVRFCTYTFLAVMALIVLFPFYWMIISSLKTEVEYRQTIPTFWPQQLQFRNYVDAFNTASLGRLFLNTMYVGVVSTLLSLVITVLSAFAFARLEFKGKNAMFAALLATMMIPGELFTITNYITINNLGWMNDFKALIVPFLVSVFYIYLLRQNFLQIPNELYLAAKVDGTSDLKYLWKVMVPLSLPTLISITILKMMGAWNSYIWPKLVANDDAHQLITNGLRNAFTSASGQVNYPVQMAAVAIVSAPLFLVFVFLRKYIMAGVSRSGIKG